MKEMTSTKIIDLFIVHQYHTTMFELAYLNGFPYSYTGANEHAHLYKKSLQGSCQFSVRQTSRDTSLYYQLHGKTTNYRWKIKMVNAILSWKVKKIWDVIWDDEIFYSFSLHCSADLDYVYSLLSDTSIRRTPQSL